LKSVGTKLRDDEYRALVERARREGVTVSEFVRRAVLAALGLPTPAQPEVGDRLAALEKRVGELEKRITDLERAVSRESLANTASKANAGTGNVASSSGGTPSGTGESTAPQATTTAKPKPRERTGASSSEGYEWCRDKDKVRNLKSFLKWVDEELGLIDWWEEDDSYCFKTREKPSKAG
jgi:hypothetical protein